ncbi:MAG: hypothetical protein JJ992_13725, partial [Planctomycetes bacterium]|nr:hypothetical protein [Planctomycetota bacterium]
GTLWGRRAGELRRGKGENDQLNERYAYRGRTISHPDQLAFTDGGDGHDRWVGPLARCRISRILGGLFARVKGSTVSVAEIERSAAFGGVGNGPFMRNPDDQLGLGVAWKTANAAAFPGQATQSPEVAIEGYWNLTVGKLCQIGLQSRSSSTPARGLRAIFSFRATGLF